MDHYVIDVQPYVQYKILTHTYKALHKQSPVYIKELLQVYRPRRDLRYQEAVLCRMVIAVLLQLLQNYGTLSHLGIRTLVHSVLSSSHLRHTYSYKRMTSKD